MISYKRIDKSEGINFKKEGSECVICHQPYVCNRCHDFSMTVQDLSYFFIVTIKNIGYRVYTAGVDKKAANYLLNNSILSDKSVI